MTTRCIILSAISVIIIFYRNCGTFANHNDHPISDGTIFNPSSSKVISIDTSGLKYNVVNAYLSPLDRHFMIAPVDCRLIDITDVTQPGIDCERLRYTFRESKTNRTFILEQVISLPLHWGWIPKLMYKNRCVPLVKIGEYLPRGTRFGLIRFGSNMTYYIPKEWTLTMDAGIHYDIGEPIANKFVKND